MRKKTLAIIILACAALQAADFKFLVYADIQGGGDGNHAKLAGIMGRIPGGVDFAIACGDLAGLSNGTVATATTWDNFLLTALALPSPFWPVRGNHDGGGDSVTMAHWTDAMSFIRDRSEYQSGSVQNDYYSFLVNNCLFVVINDMSANFTDQKAWLAAEVQTDRAKNAAHIFTFFHYPGLGANQPEVDRASQYWEAYITPYFENMPNYSGAFWGDSHRFWKGEYKGISGILVPSATTARTALPLGPGEIGGSFSGYIVVHVKGDSVLAKAYDYSEAEQASFVIKDYNPFDKMPIQAVLAVADSPSIEQHLGTRVYAIITYLDTLTGQGLVYDTTRDVQFVCLDTALALVDSVGHALALAQGQARIQVAKRGLSDTVTITITASTAVVDSIRLSLDSLTMLAEDTFQVHATGYFRALGQSFSRLIDDEALWIPSLPASASVSNGLVRGLSAGGPLAVIASLGEASDSCFFTIRPRPSFILRINFKTDTVPHASGWRADNGRAYSDARGMGWINPSSMTTRNDRDGGVLLGSFVYPSTGPMDFRISAPDGEYILKTGLGDNEYGVASLNSVLFAGDTVGIKRPGILNGIRIDTITVTGGAGAVLTVNGGIDYLVMISSEGIPMDMVADDGSLAVTPELPPAMAGKNGKEAGKDGFSAAPNPFNPCVTLAFSGGLLNSYKRVVVYDASGRRVHGASLGTAAAFHRWETAGLGSGTYLVTVVYGNRTLSRRLTLLK